MSGDRTAISLSSESYAVVLEMSGRPLVIVQRGPRMRRVAKASDAARAMAGLMTSPLREVK